MKPFYVLRSAAAYCAACFLFAHRAPATTNVSAEASGASGLAVIPDATGFSTTTAAGRGGKVLRVTNLHESGPGSLRAALEATGPRVVVFEVSGTIKVSKNFLPENPNADADGDGWQAENPAQFPGKSWGTISVGGVLYSWVVPDNPDLGGFGHDYRYTDDTTISYPRDHYRYVQLARSTDHATTWELAPWRWWRDDNLIVATFLNYGRDNAGAPDPYIYCSGMRHRVAISA